jgi:hypothetical protein
MSKMPLKYHTNIKFYTQYTYPMLICRGTDTQTDAWTNARTDNIYSIFRDKLLLLGEHVVLDALWPVFFVDF